MSIEIIRTNASHKDFVALVKELDKGLAVTDGEDHGFYNQYNKLDSIKHVIIAYENDVPIGCGAIKAFDESDNVSPLSNVPNASLINDITAPADITDLVVYEGSTSNLSTIKIMWTAPGDDGSQGIADLYEIRYSTSLITASNWENAIIFNNPPVPQNAGTSQYCYVNVLEAATIYYFAIKAFDENGNVHQVSNSPAGKIV